MLLTSTRGYAQAIKLRGIAVDRNLTANAPVIVRLSVNATALATAPADPATLARLQRTLDVYKSCNTQIVLAFGDMTATDADVEPWRGFVRSVVERTQGKVAGYQIGRALGATRPDVA